MGWKNKTKISGGLYNKSANVDIDGSLRVIDAHDARLQSGIAFRAETSGTTFASGDTVAYVGITSGATIETWLRVDIDASNTFKYKVFLEPTGTTGSYLPIRSKNPHVQFIGGRSNTYVLFDNPSFTTRGTKIREKIYGTWGIPYSSDWTILSPNQTLMFEIESMTNDNYINIMFHTEEIEDGILE